MEQREFEESAPVIDELGISRNQGWARRPVFSFNPSYLWTPQRFSTARDKYLIFSSSFMFVFELCDSGYLGFFHVAALSLLDKHCLTKNTPILFPLGNFNLPLADENGNARFCYKNDLLEFIVMENNVRIIKVDIPQIGNNRRLRGEVALSEPPGAQSLFVNSTWRRESRRFKLVRSSPWWNVEGVMQFENTSIPFIRDKAWGIFYRQRSVRPKSDVRYWAAGCGLQDGRQISFSVGYGSQESEYGSENAFFIDGQLHKLDLVTFQASALSWCKPWHFTSNDARLEMTFYPLRDSSRSNYVLTEFDQTLEVYGFFSGFFIREDGAQVRFSKITGLVERGQSRN